MPRPKLTDEQKAERRRIKAIRDSIATVDARRKQKPVRQMDISIEWKKGTYGWSPTAQARVWFQDGSFEVSKSYRAGGYGYDKESTVVAEIFTDYLAYKLFDESSWVTDGSVLYHGERKPYGMHTESQDDGYAWAYYAGGIGMSCYHDIAKFIGGALEKTGSGKSFDCYRYTDNSHTQSQEG